MIPLQIDRQQRVFKLSQVGAKCWGYYRNHLLTLVLFGHFVWLILANFHLHLCKTACGQFIQWMRVKDELSDSTDEWKCYFDSHDGWAWIHFLIKSAWLLFPPDNLLFGHSGFNFKHSRHGVPESKINQHKRTRIIALLPLTQLWTYRCWSGAFVCLSIIRPSIHHLLLAHLHSGPQTVTQSVQLCPSTDWGARRAF